MFSTKKNLIVFTLIFLMFLINIKTFNLNIQNFASFSEFNNDQKFKINPQIKKNIKINYKQISDSNFFAIDLKTHDTHSCKNSTQINFDNTKSHSINLQSVSTYKFLSDSYKCFSLSLNKKNTDLITVLKVQELKELPKIFVKNISFDKKISLSANKSQNFIFIGVINYEFIKKKNDSIKIIFSLQSKIYHLEYNSRYLQKNIFEILRC